MISENPLTNVSIVNYSDCPDAEKVWQTLYAACEDAWYYHSFSFFEYDLCAGEKFGAQNLSFFLFVGNTPVALVPVVIQNVLHSGKPFLEGRIYSGPLPWPCFDHQKLTDIGLILEAVEDLAFSELERRAKDSGVARIQIQYSVSHPSHPKDQERVERILVNRRYIDNRYKSHFMEINEDSLNNVRDRFRRYHKKFSPLFELAVWEGSEIGPELEERYFQLHTLDAGGQFRSRMSYKKQMDMARLKDSFLVTAKNKDKGEIVGMLHINVCKNAAYDSSVGIHPEYREMYVSHLLKWRTIEELIRRKVKSYELGAIATPATLNRIYSKKQIGISHFKEGWARNGTKSVFLAEKYYDSSLLNFNLDTQKKLLEEYFGLSGSHESQN